MTLCKKLTHVYIMEDLENLLALILISMFLGAFFIGGFYVGYRYRDKMSLERHKERQKKYRPSQLRGTSRMSAPSSVVSDETAESPTT